MKITGYLVEVGFREFLFEDANVALDFAKLAAQTVQGDDKTRIMIITEAEDVAV